jgi:putative membrane protein
VDATALGDLLAPVNATLNLISALCLIAGYLFIRRREARRHRAAMVGAVSASILFLGSYLVRIGLTGTHRFAGEGVARTVYLWILFSHMIMAVVAVPLVIRLLILVRRRRFHDHARLARWAYPVWLYASFTGIAVYVLLYQIYGYM